MPNLVRNILVVLVLMSALSWLLSLVRVTFSTRTILGRKGDIFEKLQTILKHRQFNIKAADPTKGRIVVDGLVNVIDIVIYGLIGNRVVFELTELADQHVQIRVFGYASFLFIRTGISKSEQYKVIDEGKINVVFDELTRD